MILAFFTDKTTVTIAVLTLGVCGFAFGEVLPRLKGKFELGPKGLKGTLDAATVKEVKVTKPQKLKFKKPDDGLTFPELLLQADAPSLHFTLGKVGTPMYLVDGDSLQTTVDYRTAEGEEFRVMLPLTYRNSSAKKA